MSTGAIKHTLLSTCRHYFIKYLLMTNISEEPFATLTVRMLFALLIIQYRSTNKISLKYEIRTVFC